MTYHSYQKRSLTTFEERAYKAMISTAYKMPKNQWFTTADLADALELELELSTEERRFLGRKFSYYANKNPNKFKRRLMSDSSTVYEYRRIV